MLWYQYTKNQLAGELRTDLEHGLDSSEAALRLADNGPNALPDRPLPGWPFLFVRQFQSPLIYILLVCAAVVYYLGQVTDATIIAVVLLVNAAIGTILEGRSGKVLHSLKKLSQAEVSVMRDGQEKIVPEPEVVRGDILVLQPGQRVPADARVVFSYKLGVDESALTGESGVVAKRDQVLSQPALPASSQHNMVFKGTAVLTGIGRAAVTGTGQDTELGKISLALLKPETPIPLQRDITLLSRVIIAAITVISLFLFLLGWQAGQDWRQMFSLVVSLAVSIIPEGLPLVLTVILAHGVWRMSRHRALVKKLQAVEALGQAEVLAVDKTGTITENQMAIVRLYSGHRAYEITGNGYEPHGVVTLAGQVQQPSPDLEIAATVAGLCSTAAVVEDFSGQYKISGDPTEAAMEVFAAKLGFTKIGRLKEFREVAEIPFDYQNKYHAMFFERQDSVFCAVTGAPEAVFRHCQKIQDGGQVRLKTTEDHRLMELAVEDFSSRALRVVAYAYRNLAKNHPFDSIDDLTFGGLFGIQDAVRPQAAGAVAQAGREGIKVVMITGDHRTTAKAVAIQAGIWQAGDLVMTGQELNQLDSRDLSKRLERISVFARVTPEDKMKIIEAYRHLGKVVAMTGDGVNDAPSLVAADLGVAMGKIGTEVAKEAADIVLLDDNLSSIVTAVEEGRVMYQNIKKSLQFLFSTSLGELLTIVAALITGLPLPVTAVQILWMNLVTDPLLGAALAMEKAEAELVGGKKGLSKSRFFLDWRMASHMVLVGGLMAVGGLWIYWLYREAGPAKAGTMALTLLVVFQWFNAINCRFLQRSVFRKDFFSNPYLWVSLLANFLFQIAAVYFPPLAKVLHIVPLQVEDWVTAIAFGATIVLADEFRKWLLRTFDRRLSPRPD